LQSFLDSILGLLSVGGRLSVISFHSLEDRMVKRFLRDHSRVDPALAKLPVVPESAQPDMRLIGKAGKASEEEIERNARPRSAVLRTAERLT
jgi:16S rRNA (cytosine1402-N4)-methyltransferase